MHRFLSWSIAFIALTMPLAATAQERGEISVFGGYSKSWDLFDPGKQGWDVSVSGNISKHLALVADFSGHYHKNRPDVSYLSVSRCFSAIFGPRYVHRIGKRLSPFAHIMYGLYQRKQDLSAYQLANDVPRIRNHFAIDLGGGMDVKVNERFSIRAIQLDGLVGDRRYGYVSTSFGAVFHLAGVSK
jgi:hypothetical protein